jgi:hypothetical protein
MVSAAGTDIAGATDIVADTDIAAGTQAAAIAVELQPDADTQAVVIAVRPRRRAADLAAVRHAVVDLAAAHAADSRAAAAMVVAADTGK